MQSRDNKYKNWQEEAREKGEHPPSDSDDDQIFKEEYLQSQMLQIDSELIKGGKVQVMQETEEEAGDSQQIMTEKKHKKKNK